MRYRLRTLLIVLTVLGFVALERKRDNPITMTILDSPYEDEGLGVVGLTLLFSPIGAVCGMVVGLLVWMFAFLLKLDAGAD